MRNFDPEYAAELAKEVVSSFWLIGFTFTEPFYITDSDTPVIHGGVHYLPRDFSFDELALAAALTVDRVTIDLDNAGREWSAILLGEDVRNREVIISKGVKLRSTAPWRTLVEERFYGIVDGWRLKGYQRAALTITNELVLWNKKTLRNAQSSCPWVFKQAGGECRYEGSEEWCDQSWERCCALGNELNFGGERFINAIQEKELWWGRTRSL